MTIRTKVVACFVAVLVVFAGVSLFGYARSRDSNARLALVNGVFLPLSRQVVQIQNGVQGLTEENRRMYSEAQTYTLTRRFVAAETLLASAGNTDGVRELSRLLGAAHRAFDAGLHSELVASLKELSQRVDWECENITRVAQAELKENILTGVGLSFFTVLLGALTLIVSQRVLAPLPTLIEGIKKIAEGNLTESLKVHPSDTDEVATLAREFNKMLGALAERDKKIRQQQLGLLKTERLAAMGQLSAEVVHEIRNPLNAISLNIDWLSDELKNVSPDVKKTLKSVSREIERLNQITESYLVRARLPVDSSQKTEVRDLLREIIDFSREEDRARNIVIDTEFSDHEIHVRTDRSRLKQAFLNVLRNARDAMPRGGHIQVRTEVRENVCRILVSDTGYGMNEMTRSGAFQPFFTTKPGGTGLGLLLTKAIVEEAHGTVSCESQLGKGTTFTFQFPA